MKRNIIVVLIALFSTACINAQSSINGMWNTGKENTIVEIREENNSWSGKILSSDNEKAPIGKLLLKDLEKDGDVWKGMIFAAKKQKWSKVKLAVKENQLELTVKAGLIRKSLTWNRAE